MDKIKVTVWNEYRHEKENDTVKAVYPNGMHKTIADSLSANDDFVIRTATLDEPQHGLSDDVIADTDVLLWWGHLAHHEVSDEIVAKLKKRVLEGMGFIPLHSAHVSKLFTLLMGTTCFLKWRDEGEKERLWNIEPSHPIAEGIGEFIELPKTEMYGERFDIPNPDKVIFISWFAGGEVFRSGCTWQRGPRQDILLQAWP